MNNLKILEALLFLKGDMGIEISLISEIMKISKSQTLQIIYDYSRYLEENKKPFELSIYNTKIKQITLRQYFPYLIGLVNSEKTKPLSNSAIEVLAIVAYNNEKNLTRGDISKIRGINSDYILNNLILKELLEYAGKDEERFGSPNIIKVANKFFDIFNISNLKELPKLDEFKESQHNTENMFLQLKEGIENENEKITNKLLKKDEELELDNNKITEIINNLDEKFSHNEKNNKSEKKDIKLDTSDEEWSDI